jgi:hypothetical protein
VSQRFDHPLGGVRGAWAGRIENGSDPAHAQPSWQAAPLWQLFHSRVWSRAPVRRSIELSLNHGPGGRSMYWLMGRIHAALLNLRREHGQGTVEYVALILLVALVMAGVIAAMKGFRTDEGKELGDVIIGKIKEAVRKVQF